ncbi:MAG: hypothetical protein ACR2JW_11875 [Thermomicrobiales bacterium]
MFSLRRLTPHVSRDTAHADCLREIGEDIVLTSPKVYESGLITSLDLRLVDLYGDCAFESRPAAHEQEIGY